MYLVIDILFFSILKFYPCSFALSFLRELSVLAGWRRSNTFPVPSNGVGALSDAAVEVLIHALLPHARLFRLTRSCIPSMRSPPPRVLSCVPCIPISSPLCYITSPFFLPRDRHTHVARNGGDNYAFGVNLKNAFTICRVIQLIIHRISIYI